MRDETLILAHFLLSWCYSSCMYRFNDDVLFFTFFCFVRYTFHIILLQSMKRDFFGSLILSLFLFCLFPMNWTNETNHRIIDHQFYGLHSLVFFLFARWCCCCHQFIYSFFCILCVYLFVFYFSALFHHQRH